MARHGVRLLGRRARRDAGEWPPQLLTASRADVKPIYGTNAETVPADTVVMVGYRQSQNDIWPELRGCVGQLHIVGGALSARDIQPAIREAHLAARSIT